MTKLSYLSHSSHYLALVALFAPIALVALRALQILVALSVLVVLAALLALIVPPAPALFRLLNLTLILMPSPTGSASQRLGHREMNPYLASGGIISTLECRTDIVQMRPKVA